jgi:alkylation response protein AidB-like acyl-CoA dehydrogenase
MTGFDAEERRLLHESMDEYFADRGGPERSRRAARAEGPGFSREAWADYARLGWLGLAIPEDQGGAGGGLTEAAILFAAAGRRLAPEPLIPTLILGAGALIRMGTDAQRARLEEIAAGERLMAVLHGEPDSGFARDHVNALARREGAGWRLDGLKAFALGAHAADELVVSARLGAPDGPVGLFLVPAGAPGLALTPAPALDERMGAAATLTDVALPAEALLGGAETDRLAEIDALLDRAALAASAEAAGAMTEAAEITTAYLGTRRQFGRKLADFQVLQHRLVDMHILCEEVRAVVHAALAAMDADRPDARRAAWRAKAQTARAARCVGGQGIQLHGGMGMTDDMAIGHYYKRLSVLEALHGDADWHLARLAQAEAAAP